MNPILKNILAVIAGVVLGSIVNGSLIILGPSIIPPPEGVDMMTPEGLAEAMKIMPPKNFIFPFLAHALGTLVGAFTTAKIAASHPLKLALGIGAWFLIGGIMMVQMIPNTPTWFAALDLIAAYLPMGWLGAKLANKNEGSHL